MRKLFYCLYVLILSIFALSGSFAKTLRVNSDNRFLEYSDGTPFFYLGDTAWELFHRLDREQADRYLGNRAEKGFTVIQAVVLAERNGLTQPNAYDDVPLIDQNPAQPNEAYFEHVDYIVNKANELGLFIGMLPTWGSYWSDNNPDRKIFTPENARSFGEYLGKRYKNKQIIWILGGDHNIHTDTEREIIEAMAQGLRAGDDGEHLFTFHPRGPGLSSDYFHKADWLDFNMVQSSHGAHDHDNGLFIEHDYSLSPPKPTLDGEPRYEMIPVGFYFDGFNRQDWFDDYDCRQAAYWAMLAGACGHTYGNNSIWQMYTPDRDAVLWARVPWYEAMDHPGSFQMGHLRKLFEARPFTQLQPAQDMILDGPRAGGKIRAALAQDGSFAFIYSPRGEKFTIDRAKIKSNKKIEIWYDPRYGVSHPIHTSDTAGLQTYTPPTRGRGCDWILIIEDAKKNYPLP
ncbi:DUF4038 domain-containing protein [candidate division KSB1 bacterium]|nr:glycoside hydrolase family 140 protein [candidate division KSB1 bacterium]RQW04819.1 MAG: DUF4038 domain-containing protein [candidate division KSB1 bacterium]